MAKALTRTCTWDRVHQPLTSGRCAAAAFCPMPLVRAISKGIRRQKNISKSVVSSFAMVPTEYVTSMTDSGELAPTSTCPKVNGDHVEISSGSRSFKHVCRDGYANDTLPDDLVRAAICEKLTYFNNRVWQITDMKTAESHKDARAVRCRWVLCNKGDSSSPDVRAQLVACEMNYGGAKEERF